MLSPLKFKPTINKLKYISFWGILLSSLSSCATPQISIDEISDRKIGKTVYLTGKVIHSAPFINDAAYQLEDTTGKIWIVTKQLPQLGQKITVKGKIEYQSLPFAQQELGDFYLIELEQSVTAIDDGN